MDRSKEYILCAATWYKELATPIHRPRNINQGIVFCGIGHVHCLHQMVAMTGKKQHEVGEYKDGFLTSRNRFVDRIEGAKMDEPETALSLMNQIKLARKLNISSEKNNNQIIISTHSLGIIREFENVYDMETRKWVKSKSYVDAISKLL